MPHSIRTEIRNLRYNIKESEEQIKLFKEVAEKVPGVMVNNYGEFYHPNLGDLINNIEFDEWYGLTVFFSHKLKLEPKKEITIHALASKYDSRIMLIGERELSNHPHKVRIRQYAKIFDRMHIPEKYLQKVRLKLISYMKKHAKTNKFDLNTLEPKLRNLIAFM
jgi:hypothetical protein